MKQFLITVLGVIVGLILFFVLVPIVLVTMVASSMDSQPVRPSAMVLSLDLRQGFPDQKAASAFAGFEGGLSTVEVIRDLEAAAKDPAVKGVYIRANTFGMPPAQTEEVRNAIAQFRQSGKFVLTHIQTDALTQSLGGYAAIAGSDEIWLQETGDFGIMGLSSEQLFLGGFFEKYGLLPQFEQREEYKNAVNTYTQKAYTPAHREADETLVNNLFATFVSYIAADRGITAEEARAAVEATPLTAADAKTRKLITATGRPEDVEMAALERAGGEAEIVTLEAYEPPKRSGPVIALVGGEGGIVTGEREDSFFGAEAAMHSDTLARALIDASLDEDVKAIVFRVSSPGGSPVASDQILAAVKTAQANGKPVIVSMGDVAASGGYYVSAAADEIVALPSTLTGSIGIFGGKIDASGAINRYLGFTAEEINRGSPAVNFFTPSRPFTNAERQIFATMIDRGYADFKAKVAEGRKLGVDQVAAVAKGRVWTGVEAKERGLVDALGGLSVAVERAKARAEIKPDADVRLKLYPAPLSPLEEFRNLFGVSEEAAGAAVLVAALTGDKRLNALARESLAGDARPRLRAESNAPDIR
jgi:protease-4